jgi:hypothetical protein
MLVINLKRFRALLQADMKHTMLKNTLLTQLLKLENKSRKLLFFVVLQQNLN